MNGSYAKHAVRPPLGHGRFRWQLICHPQFKQGDPPGLVRSILQDTGLDAARLELEVTERVLIGESSRALSILRRLKALKVKIVMDDFGTGYSSLSYLQSFPFDKLKIDRRFVSNLRENSHSAAIVRAIVRVQIRREGARFAEFA